MKYPDLKLNVDVRFMKYNVTSILLKFNASGYISYTYFKHKFFDVRYTAFLLHRNWQFIPEECVKLNVTFYNLNIYAIHRSCIYNITIQGKQKITLSITQFTFCGYLLYFSIFPPGNMINFKLFYGSVPYFKIITVFDLICPNITENYPVDQAKYVKYQYIYHTLISGNVLHSYQISVKKFQHLHIKSNMAKILKLIIYDGPGYLSKRKTIDKTSHIPFNV